ncbi:lactase/phlorizin hydrolase-like [Brachyhypopomus gauderio]|uniref:lactase/phlorizin hydrolase-like n=1 Tax=Brachyhypopomus gauderio TaxID=698409 RepID=UPI00404292A2
MKDLGRILLFCLWSFYWVCIHGEHPQNFMLLAGPLTNRLVKDLKRNPSARLILPLETPSDSDDAFLCRDPLPSQSKNYFQYLGRRGVTHFKVPLSWLNILPIDDLHHPHEETVTCYRNLLKHLKGAGIQPLLELNGSTIPEPVRIRYGGWENPVLGKMFETYASFVFSTFGDLADTYITFSHVHELKDSSQFQNVLQVHINVYQLYHRTHIGGYISLGIRASEISSLYQTGLMNMKYIDFLSVHVDYTCTMTNLREELTEVQRMIGLQHILIYQISIENCAEDSFQPLISALEALKSTEIYIVGCDVTQLLLEFDQGDKSMLSDNTLSGVEEKSTSALAYQKVWEKFRTQSPSERDAFLNGSFPDGFQWAVSTEAFQVEGGWSEHGKGETVWDRFGHEGRVFGNETADLACDSYNKVDYDVYLLRGLLAPHYQFSISWARIFPTGQKESLTEKGTQYYDKLIDALLQSGVEPTVTLHHWDLPQALQDRGGWTNDSIVGAFKDFADYCFSKFGDRVKTWNTFSSPWVVSNYGYGTGEHPPGIKDPIVASYQVTHNMLKAHAEAWHVYNDKYRKQQGGKVGIALSSEWAEPKNGASSQDVEAAERYLSFRLGAFAHPIFVNGDYPALLKRQVDQKNTDCSKEVARVPAFTPAETQRIRGTADFFGLSHHTTCLVSYTRGSCTPGPDSIGDLQAHIDPDWPTTASSQIQSVPWGLRRLVNYIAAEYLSVTSVPIYITGNGVPTEYSSDLLNDTQRIDFLKAYINEAMKAIKLDSVAVQRFTIQSLLDGFEGPQGYSERFGLHFVNFENSNRPRTPKASAYYISQVIERNGFEETRAIPFRQISGSEEESSRRPHLPPSEVPSKSKVVWEKFSPQSKFQKKLYHYGTFPEGFQWGVSTSAYQIEGGWNADGKGSSIWDTFTHKPGTIQNNDNGDVACDSYNKIEEDLYMLRALKVKAYRFSLSWPRIFPNGFRSSLNKKGVDYYNRLIDRLIAYNITPMVTLHHWDLPQALQDNNGWDNIDMIDIFNDYCDFCYETFGDRVKFWMTFNQPHTIAWFGHGLGILPPNIKKPADTPYRITHNLLKAHARAYHTYDQKYRKTQNGLVSISLNADWFEPLDVNVPREVEAADRALQFQLGWFAHPIFKNGDYPDAMKWQVGNKSALQGSPESRLPSFTEEEKAYIQGTADVFCINAYTTRMVRHVTSRLSPKSYEHDQDIGVKNVGDSQDTAIKEMRAAAWGLRRLLNWIKEEYGDPEIYITENGVATNTGTADDDTDRIFFLKTYIDEALKAHNLDGVRLKGYTAWSLMDAFEWLSGYSVSFGLHHVDFTHPDRPRTPKRSAHYYYGVIRDNGFPLPEEEKPLYGFFCKGFVWSVATASYQIEGGWRSDGKGLSIWDRFAHTPLRVGNDDTGDVACDSYHKIKEDVDTLRRLRVNHYRFSISWPRIMPDGTTRNINQAGLNYYHRLIDALLEANIKPQVTLYHWDLPQALQDVGGWENDTVVERFRDYADVVFSNLGEKVKFWITINEPYNVANIGHGYGTAAPGVSLRPGTAPYNVGHNLIKAHAEAWHLYNDKYRAKQGGIVGITISSEWALPRNPYKQEDIDAARRHVEFQIGWFAHPIFNGDYSKVMKTRIRERSLAAGLPRSRLPEFTPEEVKRINGTYDYFGFNHYTTVLAFNMDYKNLQHYDADRGVGTIHDRSWLDSGSAWLKVTPPWFRTILNFIKEEYGNPMIYITENGISERGDMNLNDIHRIHYYENYINQALKAYLLDGVDIRGYAAWTLMDNLEWATGFAEKFGLFYVNRSDPSLPRIPKRSATYYATIVNCNGFPDPIHGPHDCQIPDPEGTGTPPTSAPLPEYMVLRFLGLEVSAPDAEVTLYVLLALTLTGAIMAAFFAFGSFKAKKKAKQPNANLRPPKSDLSEHRQRAPPRTARASLQLRAVFQETGSNRVTLAAQARVAAVLPGQR